MYACGGRRQRPALPVALALSEPSRRHDRGSSLADVDRTCAAACAGEVSSREIVAACFDDIDARDGKLHAFVDVWRDDALAQADALDRERRDGLLRGPLHGLPIALKDLLHVAGRQTTAGSKSWLGRISDHTATAVRASSRQE